MSIFDEAFGRGFLKHAGFSPDTVAKAIANRAAKVKGIAPAKFEGKIQGLMENSNMGKTKTLTEKGFGHPENVPKSQRHTNRKAVAAAQKLFPKAKTPVAPERKPL